MDTLSDKENTCFDSVIQRQHENIRTRFKSSGSSRFVSFSCEHHLVGHYVMGMYIIHILTLIQCKYTDYCIEVSSEKYARHLLLTNSRPLLSSFSYQKLNVSHGSTITNLTGSFTQLIFNLLFRTSDYEVDELIIT